jgi:hypothetical protein
VPENVTVFLWLGDSLAGYRRSGRKSCSYVPHPPVPNSRCSWWPLVCPRILWDWVSGTSSSPLLVQDSLSSRSLTPRLMTPSWSKVEPWDLQAQKSEGRYTSFREAGFLLA